MRILEIAAGKGVNGAVLHCRLLVSQLAQRGHDVTLLCLPNSWIAKQVAGENIQVVHSDLRRWPADELRRIAALCRQQRIDVIHTHMTRASNFGVLLRWLARVPCVAAAQNRSLQFHWMWNDRVIACSETTRRYHRRFNLVRDANSRTVHNFIDEGRFDGLKPNVRKVLRRRWNVPETAPLMAVVGDVIARKGAIYLVRALPAILDRAPDARVLFVGPRYGTYDEKVCAEADKLQVAGNIIWLGLRRDVPRVLAASDVFVLPTLEDNLPLAILEAMRIGLPVVSTRVGGIPECVIPGVTGEIVPPRDPVALANALVPILLDRELRQQYSQAGRELVRQRFSASTQVPKIEAILDATARRPRAA
jgi:glycosyltransferase involved in cell wall biosynthesis